MPLPRSERRFQWNGANVPLHSPAAPVARGELRVNRPADEFEHQAERLSEEVMGRGSCTCGGTCAKCRSGGDPEHAIAGVPPIVGDVLRSSGQPLERATLHFMESRLGRDFSNVRIHTDGAAAASARLLGAQAYTAGNHVAFDAGKYAVTTFAGKKLLAHELIHVAQQAGGRIRIQRSPAPGVSQGATGGRDPRDVASGHTLAAPKSAALDTTSLRPEYADGWTYKSMPGYVFVLNQPGVYAFYLADDPGAIFPVDHRVAAIILKNGHPIFDRNDDALYELPRNLLSASPGEFSSAGPRWHMNGPRQFYQNPKALDLAMGGYTKEAEIWEAGHGCAGCHIERPTNGPVRDDQLDLDRYIRVALVTKVASDLIGAQYDPRNPFTYASMGVSHVLNTPRVSPPAPPAAPSGRMPEPVPVPAETPKPVTKPVPAPVQGPPRAGSQTVPLRSAHTPPGEEAIGAGASRARPFRAKEPTRRADGTLPGNKARAGTKQPTAARKTRTPDDEFADFQKMLTEEFGAKGPVTSDALLRLFRYGSRDTVVKHLKRYLLEQAKTGKALRLGEFELELKSTGSVERQIDDFLKNLEGAHFTPQAFGKKLPKDRQKEVPGGKYNPNDALVVFTERPTHTVMDQPWKDAFDTIRKGGAKEATAQRVFDEIAEGIRKTPGLSGSEKASRIARLQDEMFTELGLVPNAKYPVPSIVKWWEILAAKAKRKSSAK